MQAFSLLLVLGALAAANPLALRPTIFNDQTHSLSDIKPQHNVLQHPLTTPSPFSSNSVSLEIEGYSIFGIPIYITPIAVGTPNQVFRVWLDLSFSGLLVRSVDCGATSSFPCGYGGEQGFLYNHSASATFEDPIEDFYLPLPAHNVYGRVARDRVQLVNFGLENVTLGEVDEFSGENYLLLVMADIADGALGLAPPNATSSVPYSKHTTPNILSHLFSQVPQAKPLISFTLPTSFNTFEPDGSITLGALPAGYGKVDLNIPFLGLGDDWSITLKSLRLNPHSEGGHGTTLPTTDSLSFTPTFSTSGLAFGTNLTESLYTHLHALPDSGWLDGREFNCSYRGKLPDITFEFSSPTSPTSGTESISFTEADYTLHGYFGDDEICFLTILAHEQPGLEHVALVGSPLWEKWHVVFDLSQGEEGMGLIAREESGGSGFGDGKVEARKENVDFGGWRRRGED